MAWSGRLVLNILSMRSVIRKPPTTLLVAATTGDGAEHRRRECSCARPTSTMAPTTAMASSALVSDISGVWSSGETRRMTSNPMKPASMKT